MKKKAVDEGKATAKAMAAASEPQTEQKNLAKDSATQETPKISITATGNGKAAGKGKTVLLAPATERVNTSNRFARGSW